MKKTGFFFLMLMVTAAYGQLQQLYMAPPSHIGGLRATANDYPYVIPFADLNETFFVEFDDLEGDEKTYYYRIRRYDAQWKPSSLLPQEYIDGYDSDMIQTQENARATLQPYTHYAFRIPNEYTRIKLSGNYLIEILDEDDNVVFNIPLMVYENTIRMGIKIKRTNDPATVNTDQRLEIRLYPEGLQPLNPASDLCVVVYKNAAIFDPVVLHAPTYTMGNELRYDDPSLLTFPGGYEFLSFESRYERGYNRGVDSWDLKDLYEFYLPAYRPPHSYLTYRDIDGSYVFDASGTDTPSTEADYVRVFFRVDSASIPPGRDIYVVGRFNQWQLTEPYRLKPVHGQGYYQTTALLKQGYYDYYYVGRTPGGRIDWTALTPSFAETENRYTVLVYYCPPGARYTRLVGMSQAVSQPLQP